MLSMIGELKKRGIVYEEEGNAIICPSLQIKLHPDAAHSERDVNVYNIDSCYCLSGYLGWDDTIDFQTALFAQKFLKGVAKSG